MTILRKKSGGGYTGAYLLGKGEKGPNRAARANSKIAAFIEAFVNGSWTWTRYFCAAILENIKVGQAARVAGLLSTGSPSFSLSLGASGRALSECLWTGVSEPSVKVSEKDVLHQARTNPQAA